MRSQPAHLMSSERMLPMGRYLTIRTLSTSFTAGGISLMTQSRSELGQMLCSAMIKQLQYWLAR
jgi:hypothetical protein